MAHDEKADEVLRIAEAAAVLGIHQQTLRRWADDGLVAVVKMPSGERRFKRSVLVEISAGGKLKGRS